MAAKGAQAKLDVIAKIQEAFGDNFIGEVDKKIYVWANDGGEMVQIAIAMTCPKVPVESNSAIVIEGKTPNPTNKPVLQCKVDTDGNITDHTGVKGVIPQFEISDEESSKVADLLAELGIEE